MVIRCIFNENKEFANPGLRHVTAGILATRSGEESPEVLLVLRTKHMKTEPNKWALPAGYMEIGERCISTARREGIEETGFEFEITGVVCLTDDPDRPDDGRQNIGLIFSATALKQIGEADDESSAQGWFRVDELPDNMAFEYRAVIEHSLNNPPIPLSALFLQ